MLNFLLSRRTYLLLIALGLVLASTTYGIFQPLFLTEYFGLRLNDNHGPHLFRAVMGVYCALALFWVIAAFRPDWQNAAVANAIILMGGVAAARLVSITIDGIPHPLLLIYTAIELFTALLGMIVLARTPDEE